MRHADQTAARRPLGRWAWTVSSLALLVLLAAAGAAGQDSPRFKVIVNASNPVDRIPREQLALLFLDRSARWKDRAPAPVDQSLQTPIREAFSRDVLQMSLSAVRSHWERRMMVQRETPPPVKASDTEVIAHVEKKPGGVGYVSDDAVLPDTVKILSITE